MTSKQPKHSVLPAVSINTKPPTFFGSAHLLGPPLRELLSPAHGVLPSKIVRVHGNGRAGRVFPGVVFRSWKVREREPKRLGRAETAPLLVLVAMGFLRRLFLLCLPLFLSTLNTMVLGTLATAGQGSKKRPRTCCGTRAVEAAVGAGGLFANVVGAVARLLYSLCSRFGFSSALSLSLKNKESTGHTLENGAERRIRCQSCGLVSGSLCLL